MEKRWEQKDPEKTRKAKQDILRKYRIENPEKVKEFNKNFYTNPKHKQHIKECIKTYAQRNRERLNQKQVERSHRKGISKNYRGPYKKSKI